MSADTSTSAPDPLDGISRILDNAAGAAIAQMTAGLSPATILQAFSDWGMHLAFSPGKQLQLAAKATRKNVRFLDYALRSASDADAPPAIEPQPELA